MAITSKLVPHFLRNFFRPVFPRNAITITADYVASLRASKPGSGFMENSAYVPLAAGVLTPSQSKPNVNDAEVLRRALTQAVQRTGLYRKEVNLLIPDIAARVFLIPLEQIPSKASDLEMLLRYKVKKSLPFPVEEAAVSYQAQTLGPSRHEVILTVISRDVLREYESAVESIDLEPGYVTVEHFGVVRLLDRHSNDWRTRPTLLFRLSPRSFTTSIYHQGFLRFYRSMEKDYSPASGGTLLTPEILFDEIYPSLAYFQDKFESQVQVIYFSGLPAGGERLCAALQKLTECAVTEIRPEKTGAPVSGIPSDQLNQIFSPLMGVQLGAY